MKGEMARGDSHFPVVPSACKIIQCFAAFFNCNFVVDNVGDGNACDLQFRRQIDCRLENFDISLPFGDRSSLSRDRCPLSRRDLSQQNCVRTDKRQNSSMCPRFLSDRRYRRAGELRSVIFGDSALEPNHFFLAQHLEEFRLYLTPR